MAEFLVEHYLARNDISAVASRSERARRAAAELTRDGTPVRYLCCIFVPEDETCFYLYEAASAEPVRDAALRAGLAVERVTEAIGDPQGAPR